MREIKFRAWDKNDEWMVCNIQDAYDGLPYSKENAEHIVDSYDWVSGFNSFLDSDDFIPMQYTGLKDRNGVEIYEGDIVDNRYTVVYPSSEYQFRHIGIVKFDVKQGCLVIHNTDGNTKRLTAKTVQTNKIKVLGNIYDNPELMEGQE